MKIMPNLEFRKSGSVCVYSVAEWDEKLVRDWYEVKKYDQGILSKHYSGWRNCREIKTSGEPDYGFELEPQEYKAVLSNVT